ncbi:MAG: hypothetical protein KKA79_02000 [Nanoarchaeota archaeon]|nr:hypothetical protein [Nanoarchaeota archaeon]
MEENRGKLILERKMIWHRILFAILISVLTIISIRAITGGIAAIRKGDIWLGIGAWLLVPVGIIFIILFAMGFKSAVIQVYESGVFLNRGKTITTLFLGGFYKFDDIEDINCNEKSFSPNIEFYVKKGLIKKIPVEIKNSKEVYDLIIQTRDEYFRKNVNNIHTV